MAIGSHPPENRCRVFVVEQPGRIRIIKNEVLLSTPFLAIEHNVSNGFEQGLLSVAFHPDFESNSWFFVNYTNNAGDTVIARYEVGDNPAEADETSEKILLTIPQPLANHNGGQLAFGPDGYLYVGMGDGGGSGDPGENAQDDSTLLGKLLRLDVDVDTPPYYAVPADNPNAEAGDPLGLIWAKGLRNPWRFSFDRGSENLYLADVGQNHRIIGGSAQDHDDRTADLEPGDGLSIDEVTSFGEDARGELYIADRGGGIFKIIPDS